MTDAAPSRMFLCASCAQIARKQGATSDTDTTAIELGHTCDLHAYIGGRALQATSVLLVTPDVAAKLHGLYVPLRDEAARRAPAAALLEAPSATEQKTLVATIAKDLLVAWTATEKVADEYVIGHAVGVAKSLVAEVDRVFGMPPAPPTQPAEKGDES